MSHGTMVLIAIAAVLVILLFIVIVGCIVIAAREDKEAEERATASDMLEQHYIATQQPDTPDNTAVV